MGTGDFYTSLPPLQQFFQLTNSACYVDAPANWYVLITDIVGSTQAIANGRYKDVNFLGASSIIAVLNSLDCADIPFVFGGDGASLLVSPLHFAQARDALLAVRRMAHRSFGMDLRVGAVPVETVQAAAPLKVAKFQLAPHCFQASFMGGGMTYATELIKSNPLYQLNGDDSDTIADLTGLECRWQDVPSPHGQIVSLIVTALPSHNFSNNEVYCQVLAEIARIYGEAQDYNPLTPHRLKLSFNPAKLWTELKARSRSTHWWDRLRYLAAMLMTNFLGLLFMHLKLTLGGVEWGKYKRDVCLASDYQKIDDTLRMIISGTPAQTRRLVRYLEAACQQGQLAYGLHLSNRSLVTCLILDRRDRHLHLIDGADGGYTLAAKHLKEKLHRKAQNWQAYTQLLRHRHGNSPQAGDFPNNTKLRSQA